MITFIVKKKRLMAFKIHELTYYFYLYNERIIVKTLKPQQSVSSRGSSSGASAKYIQTGTKRYKNGIKSV